MASHVLAVHRNQIAIQATVTHLAVLIAIAIPRAHIHRGIPIVQGRQAAAITITAKKVNPQAKQVTHITQRINMMPRIFTRIIMMIFGIMKMPRIIIMNTAMIKEVAL